MFNRIPPSALTPILILTLTLIQTGCGGDSAGSSAGTDSGGPELGISEEDSGEHRVSVEINGETFTVEGRPTGPKIHFGTRKTDLTIGCSYDPKNYMGEGVFLQLDSPRLEEGTLTLVPGTGGFTDRTPEEAEIILDVDGRPEFQELRSVSGSVVFKEYVSQTKDGRFTVLRLEGTFEGEFRGKSGATHNLKGEFLYRD